MSDANIQLFEQTIFSMVILERAFTNKRTCSFT